jgi:hypothetical protein
MNKNFEHSSITGKKISPKGPTKGGDIQFCYRKDTYKSPCIESSTPIS